MSEIKGAPLRAEDVLADVGYNGFVAALFSRSGDRSKDYAHAVLGIATESVEFLFAVDEINGLEEQGDLRFYGQAVINLVEEFTGVDFDYEAANAAYDRLVRVGEVEGTEDAIDKARGDMLDAAKRWVGYGERGHPNLLDAGAKAVALVQFVSAHGRYSEPDPDTVELSNTAKLLDRYKELKFNADRAVDRDVKSERRVLEASAS